MNKPDFVPKVTKQSELGNVYDINFKAVQPYLYRVRFSYKATKYWPTCLK